MNSKKNSCRGNYMRKYGSRMITFWDKNFRDRYIIEGVSFSRVGHNSTTAPEKFILTSLEIQSQNQKIQQIKIAVTNSLYKAETVYEGRLKIILLAMMTLNLPLSYWFWFIEYCQTSPNKSKSPILWHLTSILFCCIFGPVQVPDKSI